MYHNNNQYYDYMEAGTSQGYNQQDIQQQGWYQEQTYGHYYNDNKGYNRHQQQNYRQQNFQAYQQPQHQNKSQNYGFNINQYMQKNFQTQTVQKPWKKISNKRPHELAHNGSPEPKRYIYKRNSFEQNNQYNTTNAAYQTMPQQMPFQRAPKKKPNNNNGQQQGENPIIKIQEERQKDWNEKFQLTLNLLSGCKAGEEIQLLLSYLQPVRATWNQTKDQIHNDLLRFLSPMGVEKVLIFGSTLTGLDFHGSDLDFYIQLKTQPVGEDETRITINKVAKLSRFLHSSDFMLICTIQNARVPLIRLLHRKSKITCDVNFSSQFGYYNSYFIGHVIGYDRRIRDLAVILKLWSKSYKLASQMIITNYCLMMLMIFYLQNLNTPMLDKIINVQKTRSPMVLDSHKKWNFYFNDSINKSKSNCQTLRELLVGFFEFYSKLSPKDHVVSLLTGRLIKRENFDTDEELSESRKLIASSNLQPFKSENSDFFHVQDAFELNLNIGIKVKKHVEFFFELTRLSFEKCEELKDRPFAELLVNLFTEIKMPVATQVGNGGGGEKKSKNKNKSKKKFEMIIHAVPGDLKQCLDILQHQNPEKLLTPEDQQKYFYDHTVEHTKEFLQEMYLCTIVPDLSESTSNPFQTRFKVILQLDTINGRKKINYKSESTIDTEKYLSKKMAEKNIRFDLDAVMVIQSKDKGKTVEFEVYDENSAGKSAVQNFGNYFSINILTSLRYYLKKKADASVN